MNKAKNEDEKRKQQLIKYQKQTYHLEVQIDAASTFISQMESIINSKQVEINNNSETMFSFQTSPVLGLCATLFTSLTIHNLIRSTSREKLSETVLIFSVPAVLVTKKN